MPDMKSQCNGPQGQFVILLLIVFMGFMASSVPYLIFPSLFLNPAFFLLPDTFGPETRALMLGVTLAAYPLGQFIGSPILGKLSDRYGRKHLLTASLFVASLCNLGTGLALESQALLLVIVSRFAAGIMEGNVAIARAMAADMKTIPKQEAFGKLNAAISISYFVGPLVGALLAENAFADGPTISLPFYAIGMLFLVIAAVSALALPAQSAVKHVLAKRRTFDFTHLFQNKRLRFMLILSTVFTLAVDIFYEFGPVHLTATFGFSPTGLIPYNLVLCAALAIGSGWLVTFVSKRFTSRSGIIAATGLFALLLLSMACVSVPWLMLPLFALSGLTISLASTLLMVEISDAASDNIQGEVMGVQMAFRVLGDAVICLCGGVLLSISSHSILVIAGFVSVVALVFVYMRERVVETLTNT